MSWLEREKWKISDINKNDIRGGIDKGEYIMAEQNCENCNFRAKYDNNPKSFLGRLWHWHAGWCPGWKAYMKSLPDEERNKIAKQYNLIKYVTK